MIMKGIFTYDRWGMLQRFVGELVYIYIYHISLDLLGHGGWKKTILPMVFFFNGDKTSPTKQQI